MSKAPQCEEGALAGLQAASLAEASNILAVFLQDHLHKAPKG